MLSTASVRIAHCELPRDRDLAPHEQRHDRNRQQPTISPDAKKGP
jgi:hypothetical protein